MVKFYESKSKLKPQRKGFTGWIIQKAKSFWRFIYGNSSQSNIISQQIKHEIIKKDNYRNYIKSKVMKRKPISQKNKANKKFIHFLQNKLQKDKSSQFCCPICIDMVVFPVSTSCGHIYCYKCLQQDLILRSNCAVCRTPIRQTTQLAVCQALHQIVNKKLVSLLSQNSSESYSIRYKQNQEYIQKRTLANQHIKAGQKIDAKDTQYIWCKAKIKEVFYTNQINEKSQTKVIKSVLVHYDHWDRIYDQVIQIKSKRLAPFGAFTSRIDIPRYNLAENIENNLRGAIIQGGSNQFVNFNIQENNNRNRTNLFDFLFSSRNNQNSNSNNNNNNVINLNDDNQSQQYQYVRENRINNDIRQRVSNNREGIRMLNWLNNANQNQQQQQQQQRRRMRYRRSRNQNRNQRAPFLQQRISLLQQQLGDLRRRAQNNRNGQQNQNNNRIELLQPFRIQIPRIWPQINLQQNENNNNNNQQQFIPLLISDSQPSSSQQRNNDLFDNLIQLNPIEISQSNSDSNGQHVRNIFDNQLFRGSVNNDNNNNRNNQQNQFQLSSSSSSSSSSSQISDQE